MKHKLKATITFEYEVDSGFFDPSDLHNIIKTELTEFKGYPNRLISDKHDFDTVYDIKIEPVDKDQQQD